MLFYTLLTDAYYILQTLDYLTETWNNHRFASSNMTTFAENCFVYTSTDDDGSINIFILKDGKHVVLNPMTFSMLVRKSEQIAAVVKCVRQNVYTRYKCHIGRAFYLRIDNIGCCVDIRRYYKSSGGVVLPTHDAVSLTFEEWEALRGVIPNLNLPSVEHCSDQHANQMTFLACSQCNPFDYCNY